MRTPNSKSTPSTLSAKEFISNITSKISGSTKNQKTVVK